MHLLLRSTFAALLLSVASQGSAPSAALAQSTTAGAAGAAGASGGYGEKDVIPLDAVLAVIEDRPILGSQVLARQQIMRATADPAAKPVTTDQAYRALFESRLIDWDAQRNRLGVLDEEIDRMLDSMATRNGMKDRVEFLAEVKKSGTPESAYRGYVRQALIEARWEATLRRPPGAPATQPASTRAQLLAALETEALVDRHEPPVNLRPLPQRTCLPRSVPKLPAAQPGKGQLVAAVCIEGNAGPETDARLAELQRTVPPQAPLSRDAVARSLSELLDGKTGAEAATVYGLPLRPGGDQNGPLLVVYRLRPRPLLSGIELQGVPDGVVVPSITVAPNTRYSHRELREHLESTLTTLHNAGYLDARAQSERLPRLGENEPLRIRLKLVKGARTYIARLALPGVAEARLAEMMALIGLRPGDPLSEFALLAGRDKLGEYYMDRGFIKAHVESHTTESAAPRADGSPQVAVRMVVTEGKQYRLGSIKLTGALPLPEAELQKLIKVQRGEVFRVASLRKDLERMIEAGKRAGKPTTIDAASSISDATAIVDWTLTFQPSPPS